MLRGHEFSKRVVVKSELVRTVFEREQGGLWQQIVNPGELPLPRAGPLEQIEIQYPLRVFRFRTWKIEWLLPYVALTLVAALLLKGALRTEL